MDIADYNLQGKGNHVKYSTVITGLYWFHRQKVIPTIDRRWKTVVCIQLKRSEIKIKNGKRYQTSKSSMTGISITQNPLQYSILHFKIRNYHVENT